MFEDPATTVVVESMLKFPGDLTLPELEDWVEETGDFFFRIGAREDSPDPVLCREDPDGVGVAGVGVTGGRVESTMG